MGIRDYIARTLGLPTEALIEARITEAVTAARQALPIMRDYDPNNEGYRRAGGEQTRADMSPMSQDAMLALAYYLYDSSGLCKRFVRDTKNFVLGEGVTFSVANDTDDGAAQQVLNDFWTDPFNQMNLRLPKRIEFFGLLGEQCWPTVVNPHNGRVQTTYVDPQNIAQVRTLAGWPEIAGQVVIQTARGIQGKTMRCVLPQLNYAEPGFNLLSGDCFFFSINNPPNDPRGRSDLIHLFDFISGFEEGLFDELDRLKQIKAYVWDVTLKGATDEQIREFLSKNPAPKSGSVRAHNEQVEWKAVTPDLKSGDNKSLFDLMKNYLSACMNRPDSWLGSGGKAYQTEADLMGEPTFKDLGERQRYVKYIIEQVLQFALDQAQIHRALPAPKDGAARYQPVVDLPEMSTKDVKRITEALTALATSLTVAQTNGWLTKDTAAKIYASVAGQAGVEIDAAAEIEALAGGAEDDATADYDRRERIVNDIIARLEAKRDDKA